MIDSAMTYIWEHFPQIAFLFICCAATWKVKEFYDSSRRTSKQVDELPCGLHGEEISLLKNREGKIDDMARSIRKIEEWIIKLDKDAMADLVRKCSPYMLTDLGKALLETTGGKACIDSNIEMWLSLLEQTHPQTAYDVEINALAVLSDNTNLAVFNGIKDFLYHSPSTIGLETLSGEQETKVDMRRILMIMSIYLRDKYFEQHTELDVSN